jgi:Leucine-rich repeat (LRR) protein
MSSRVVSFLRSLLRFRLRTLLLAVLVISVGMGIYVKRVKKQQESISAVKRLGGWAYYDYEVKEDGQYDPQGESWVPAWLRKRLADDYFHPVVQVNMVYNDDTGKRLDNLKTTDEVLSHLDGLPRLEMLLLHGTQASDKGLVHVGKLTNLRRLLMWDAHDVTDAGVAHLAGCRKLEYLHLSESQIGDESARVFSQLPRLKGLSLQGNNLTDEGLVHLGEMTQLTDLWIGCMDERRSKLTDDGLAHLANLTELDTLEVQRSQVTNDGLSHLTGLKKLRWLILDSTQVTDASALQAALPQCKIQHSLPTPPFTPPILLPSG